MLMFLFKLSCKFRYERFVMALEESSKDMLPSLKDIATKVCSFLLWLLWFDQNILVLFFLCID